MVSFEMIPGEGGEMSLKDRVSDLRTHLEELRRQKAQLAMIANKNEAEQEYDHLIADAEQQLEAFEDAG